MTRFTCFAISILTMLLSGCQSRQSVASRGGEADGGTDLPENAACTCIDPSMPCCAEGLFCYAAEHCNVMTEGGCYTEGRCVPKRDYGEPCDDVRQCADGSGFCAGPAGGEATCYPPPIGEERCEEDLDCSPGRVCASSYCKLMAGEPCSSSDECASNRCHGTSPLDYRCL